MPQVRPTPGRLGMDAHTRCRCRAMPLPIVCTGSRMSLFSNDKHDKPMHQRVPLWSRIKGERKHTRPLNIGVHTGPVPSYTTGLLTDFAKKFIFFRHVATRNLRSSTSMVSTRCPNQNSLLNHNPSFGVSQSTLVSAADHIVRDRSIPATTEEIRNICVQIGGHQSA